MLLVVGVVDILMGQLLLWILDLGEVLKRLEFSLECKVDK